MDLEAESIVSIDTGMSDDITDSCNKLLETQKKIEATEEELKKLKDVETTLSEQTIPNLMQQAGVELIKLTGGISVEVKPFYSARIPASRSEEAFNWLREHGHGDLIKNQVSLEFGMKQDNEAKSIIEELKAKGLPVKQKTTVHPSSLRGFVREQIQDLGKDVPADLFGTYVANKTKITIKE
ncbi:hypothetical protein HTVC023P_gp01 [Pelagibacter phage HTVC023P]|nr:hypothetical protein HTVC023P_gp01 [Pelagibacter phage HTVC023P]